MAACVVLKWASEIRIEGILLLAKQSDQMRLFKYKNETKIPTGFIFWLFCFRSNFSGSKEHISHYFTIGLHSLALLSKSVFCKCGVRACVYVWALWNNFLKNEPIDRTWHIHFWAKPNFRSIRSTTQILPIQPFLRSCTTIAMQIILKHTNIHSHPLAYRTCRHADLATKNQFLNHSDARNNPI